MHCIACFLAACMLLVYAASVRVYAASVRGSITLFCPPTSAGGPLTNSCGEAKLPGDNSLGRSTCSRWASLPGCADDVPNANKGGMLLQFPVFTAASQVGLKMPKAHRH